MKPRLFPGVALYRLVRRSFRIVEETQRGITRFVPEYRRPIWPFWRRFEYFTSEYTTASVSYSTLSQAREYVEDQQGGEVVRLGIHSANDTDQQRRAPGINR